MATTPSLTPVNYYSTTLSGNIGTTDTTIYLNGALPATNEGYLEIGEGLSTKEIVYFTSKGANFVTLPSVGAGRGVGGTSAAAHNSGETVKMKLNAEWWLALQNGNSMATSSIVTATLHNASVTADKLSLSPGVSNVATSETTSSASYTALTTAQSFSVTVGANGLLLVHIGANLQGSGGNQAYMSFALSGANTLASADAKSIFTNTTTAEVDSKGRSFLLTGLSAGATTVTAQFRSASGTATFSKREIHAIPL